MIDREWREAADMRPATVWLAVVLLTAAVLRFWRIGHGIPYAIGVDEPEIVGRVVTMMRTGDLNPRFFDYPGLVFYLHLPVAVARFLWGAVGQEFRSLADAGPEHFYLWSRAVTAAFGVATVVLVHQIGMRWGARHALLAAGLMAVMPMHVRESHFVLTDVPMTFFVTLTFLWSLKAQEERRLGAFVVAGIAAGLSTGMKYTAGIVLLAPLVAAWTTFAARPSRAACAGASVAAAGLAFLVVAPYTLLDLPGFLNGFAHLVSYYAERPAGAEPGWVIYAKHLRLNLQWPAFLLMLSGIGLGLVRAVKGPGQGRWALLVAVPVVYFWSIADRALIYGRYLLPVVPFACLLAAIAVVSGVSLLRRFDIPRAARTLLIVGLTVAAVLPPAWRAASWVRDLGRPTTQEAAWIWIDANVPTGSRVVLERAALWLPGGRFQPEHVRWLVDRSLDDYRGAGVAFIVASSESYGPIMAEPERDRRRHEAYVRFFRETREVAVFTPGPDRAGPEFRIFAVNE